MATVDQIAKQQRQALADRIAADRAALEDAIAALETRIIALARKRLETDDAEKLLGPKVNLKMAQKLHADLVKEFKTKYDTEVRKVVDGYDEIAASIRDQWAELGTAIRYTALDREMMDTLATSYYDEFKKFGTDAEKKMTRAMYDAVAGQSGFSVLESAISAALTGKLAKNGRPMSTYAKTFAQDATMNFHNAVTLKKAADAGIEQFLYYGNLMATSRPFCIERAGKKYTRAEIESWTFSWQGKSGPAMTHRGGYNCRHHWMPLSPDWTVGKATKTAEAEKATTLAVNGTETVTSELSSAIKDAMTLIPPTIQSQLASAGYQVQTGMMTTSIMPELKGLQPRGWPKGTTWDYADALFDESKKRIVLAENYIEMGSNHIIRRKPNAVKYDLLHETGHAVDLELAAKFQAPLISQSAEFDQVWSEDLGKMSESDKNMMSYLTINVGKYAARSESFAEVFNVLVGGDSEVYNAKFLKEKLPKTFKFVKGLLA